MVLSGEMGCSSFDRDKYPQILGGIFGATLAYLAYKDFDGPRTQAGTKLEYSTGPEIDHKPWNVVTEAIGT